MLTLKKRSSFSFFAKAYIRPFFFEWLRCKIILVTFSYNVFRRRTRSLTIHRDTHCYSVVSSFSPP